MDPICRSCCYSISNFKHTSDEHVELAGSLTLSTQTTYFLLSSQVNNVYFITKWTSQIRASIQYSHIVDADSPIVIKYDLVNALDSD